MEPHDLLLYRNPTTMIKPSQCFIMYRSPSPLESSLIPFDPRPFMDRRLGTLIDHWRSILTTRTVNQRSRLSELLRLLRYGLKPLRIQKYEFFSEGNWQAGEQKPLNSLLDSPVGAKGLRNIISTENTSTTTARWKGVTFAPQPRPSRH
ncbi:hypothetical protein E2C01_042998 [Portunus trituberculatus]|uniref:Uncharacterized protein n=1 Tax=Portunus trituberculatus TaxID=210409 RepID=A0A5B7FRR1_PORTR|nr:hypothetical protein [Portunus trituberculatus]